MERDSPARALALFLFRSLVCLLSAFPFPTLGNGSEQGNPVIRTITEPPPEFSVLSGPQTTEADIYYGGLHLTSAFVQFDPLMVEIIDPLPVIEAIPNVKNPESLSTHLSGPRATNSGRICSSRRAEGCGMLQPQIADVIFDESNFRLDLFINPQELLVHELQYDRYLPPASSSLSSLHNIRMNLSGISNDAQYNLTSESFIAKKNSRLRSRYGLSDDGPSLYELTFQQDRLDHEYEIGSYRTIGRSVAFTSDLEVLGFRAATSTKRRTDLDQATATPLFLFLAERSRVDIYRGNELIDSRYYNAGHQQIDTSDFPDGAYEVNLQSTGISGALQQETQFFVRSMQIPPAGEPQYYFETGRILERVDQTIPRLTGDTWVRAGIAHRIKDYLALEHEVIHAAGTSFLENGAFFLRPRWNIYTSTMRSTDGDTGYTLRGSLNFRKFSAHVNIRRIIAGESPADPDEFRLVRESYTQGSATLSIPIKKSHLVLRARVNDRHSLNRNSIGFAFYTSLFRLHGLFADFSLEGNYAEDHNWIQAGIQFRWQRTYEAINLHPRIRHNRFQDNPNDSYATFDGYWNTRGELGGFGQVDRSIYIVHDDTRSNIGARFTPREIPLTDLDIGYQRNRASSDVYYTLNNRVSIATTQGRTTIGDGGHNAGAVLINITGNADSKFEVLVDNRPVGHAWTNLPNVISLRPYETYSVRIRPTGDKIVAYEERAHEVTLYPGNVQSLEFTADTLTVLVGRAVYEDGNPVKHARIENTNGYGATDELGWFQVELTHRDPLILKPRKGGISCMIMLPEELAGAQELAVTGELTCRSFVKTPSTQAPP